VIIGSAGTLMFTKSSTSSPPPLVVPSMPAPTASAQSQPPGEAPPGKVWSPEHGHWHDAPSSAAAPALISPSGTQLPPLPVTTPTATSEPVTAQPPGEAPPGKVWSPEHGHWHDAPVSVSVPTPVPATPLPAVEASTTTPTPPVVAPEDKKE
jgi:hypothetical protein